MQFKLKNSKMTDSITTSLFEVHSQKSSEFLLYFQVFLSPFLLHFKTGLFSIK